MKEKENRYKDIYFPSPNNIKFYLGKVSTIDENYLITFSIPGILENIDTLPTAYPISGQHIQQVLEDDTVLIIQPDYNTHFFQYSVINLSNFTGMFFGDVKIDISDGVKLVVSTKEGVNLELDGDAKTIKLGTATYSLGQLIEDLDKAFQNLKTEGSPALHMATAWYASEIVPFITKAKQVFPK